MSAPRRAESDYAARRKLVRLVELKLVELLKTDDALVFEYNGRAFPSAVTIDACIGDASNPHQTRAAEVRANGLAVYDKPSNWTLDCVDRYWREAAEPHACKTNPSGYARIKLVRTGRTLNELRDQYMQLHKCCGTTTAQPPAEVRRLMDARQEQRAAKRQRVASAPDLQQSLSSATLDSSSSETSLATTVSTLRAQSTSKGYKAIAERLEQLLNASLRKQRVYEATIEKLVLDARAIGANNDVVRSAMAILTEQQALPAKAANAPVTDATEPTETFRAYDLKRQNLAVAAVGTCNDQLESLLATSLCGHYN